MTKLNLREFYPSAYKTDYWVEAPNEIALFLFRSRAEDAAAREKIRYHRAFYSLDFHPMIEYEALFHAESPESILEREYKKRMLYDALQALPKVQSRRLYAYYILNMPQEQIARIEGVTRSSVNGSIRRGLKNLEKILKKIL